MKRMTQKNIIIVSIAAVILIIGITIGISVTSSNDNPPAEKQNSGNKQEPVVSDDTHTKQRDMSKYEKIAMEYLLEATFSPNIDKIKLKQLGGCKEDEDKCALVNNFYDNNDNITGRAPEFISKPGTYYVGSDIANQVLEEESQVLIYILIPPNSMSSMKEKEPADTYGFQSYQRSNLVVFNVKTDSSESYKLKNYDPYSAADYKEHYVYSEFISSSIGKQITKEANLNWRSVNVQSKTKFF
jgi:hypothetical protein